MKGLHKVELLLTKETLVKENKDLLDILKILNLGFEDGRC
jgi:hypothetical protein